jgi:molybdopterin-guanine dinucleotide biosynthesis protein A
MTVMPQVLPAESVCAVILAGGRGSRMGGIDKGLQVFRGRSLVQHALERLRMQTLGAPAHIAINANRNQTTYALENVAVWPDTLDGFAGPLAGFQTALQQCATHLPTTEYLLTVPCDSPLFPLDLLERMAEAMLDAHAEAALASAPETADNGQPQLRNQPVFCLLRTRVLADLDNYLAGGGRKIDSWTQRLPHVVVAFDRPGDQPNAFFNANTLAQLQQLERE